MPYHASMLYSRNVQALLLHLAPEGELTLDWSDEITSGACVAGKQERMSSLTFVVSLSRSPAPRQRKAVRA